MFRFAAAGAALLALTIGVADAGQPARSGAVADQQGVWINGQYFGHDPMRRALRQAPGQPGAAARQHTAEPYAVAPASLAEPCGCPDAWGPACGLGECEVGCGCEPGCGCDLGCGDLECCDLGCCDDCPDLCGAAVPCCGRGVYGGVAFAYGWAKGADAPALVTTSDAGTVQDDAGVLGLATTSTLFGAGDLLESGQAGGRATLGVCLGGRRNLRAEFVYAVFEGANDLFDATDDDFAILARPFFNVDTSQQDALLSVFPSVASGSLRVDASSEYASYELQTRQDACCWRGARFELIAGYRGAQLDESLSMSQSTTALSGATAGSVTDLTDSFRTKNLFHGGQLGLTCRVDRNRRWGYDWTLKTALGATRQEADIAGVTTITASGGGSTTTDAGLMALASNQGQHFRTEFGTVSEVGLTLRYKLRRSTSLSLGYNIVFWSDVLRAVEQVDTTVNPTQIPPGSLTGDARPAFNFDTSSYWIQGLRIGLDSRF